PTRASRSVKHNLSTGIEVPGSDGHRVVRALNCRASLHRWPGTANLFEHLRGKVEPFARDAHAKGLRESCYLFMRLMEHHVISSNKGAMACGRISWLALRRHNNRAPL